MVLAVAVRRGTDRRTARVLAAVEAQRPGSAQCDRLDRCAIGLRNGAKGDLVVALAEVRRDIAVIQRHHVLLDLIEELVHLREAASLVDIALQDVQHHVLETPPI